MAIPEITQENFRILLPGKIARVIEMLAKDLNCSSKEALLIFYRSKTYRELEQEETKAWWQSSMQLYRAFKADSCHLIPVS